MPIISPLAISPHRIGGRSWSRYWKTLISATVETAAPTHVVLTFPTAQTSLGASDFTITGFTVSSASWAGAVLTLVLSRAVLVFDEDLTITFVTTSQTATVTNNVADDGETVFWGDNRSANLTINGSNLIEIWWDILTKDSALGAEQNSGNIVEFAVYQITATQTNYFYTGCKVGDVFACRVVKACDANNKVKRYAGNHLTMGDVNKRPVYQNGHLYFPGVDEFLKSAPFTYNQPEYIYMVIKQRSWVNGNGIIDGSGTFSGALYQTGSTPAIALRAGAGGAVASNNQLAIDSWGIVRIEINGASSKLQINENAATTGNPGTNNLGAIKIGALASDAAEFELTEAIFRKSSAGWDDIYTYLRNKWTFFFDNIIQIGWMTDNHILSTAVESPEIPDIYGVVYAHTCKQATRQAIDKFNEREVNLILNTGDIIGDLDGVTHFMEEWNRGVAQKELTIGNHDMIVSKANLISGFGYGEYDVNAGSPFNQTFVLDNGAGVDVRIIIVDTTRYLEDGSSYVGRCPVDVRNWIADILASAEEDDVFICMHHAPHTWDSVGTFVQEDAEALDAIVAADLIANPNRRIKCFVGHDHGYGDIRIYSRPGWANWPCYIGRKAIADYEPGHPQNGGFYILNINDAGSVQVELFDKIFPYSS